ncbi:MAG: bifunctional phosphoribosylaminoimidazolecarboxamide formyltransferase/IMP cyclohydrolase [Buchnera aphidicola (Melaphis rhois)]
MKNNKTINNALISISNKTGIIEFARHLVQKNINLFSTSGTKKILDNEGIKSIHISEYTNFPEIMRGRIKTLHHKIYAGILSDPNKDQETMKLYEIIKIDLVVINFYSFSKISNKTELHHNDIIELIDIGGPTIVRAASKNYKNVVVVVKPNNYYDIIQEMNVNNNKISQETRLKLANIAFQYVLNYDYGISKYFSNISNNTNSSSDLPKYLHYVFKKKQNLAYGENKHQKAGLYTNLSNNYKIVQTQGKKLSYNNLSDADIAISCVQEFKKPTCIIIKHGNPCGAATSHDHISAYLSAYNSDPTSAFGGVIAFNSTIEEKAANVIINQQFVELILAPYITDSALKIFSKKPNIRIIKYCNQYNNTKQLNIQSINGAFLIQTSSFDVISQKDWKVVSKKLPTLKEKCDALFALKIVKYIKSNAIVYVRDLKTISIGSGQTSRIGAIKIATIKANENKVNLKKSTIASDGFFPFKDSIEIIAKQGTSCIIQPGGSIRDKEIIASVDQNAISMIFTKKRYFKH